MKFISEPALKRTLHQDISLIINNKWNVLVQCSSKSRLGLLCKWYKSRHLRRFSFKDVYSRKKLLKIFTQLVHILIRVRKIFNCNVSFQISLSQCLVIVANELWTWLDQVVSALYFRKKYHNSDRSCFHLVLLLPFVLNKK